MIPTGEVNIGNLNYIVNVNGRASKVEDINNLKL